MPEQDQFKRNVAFKLRIGDVLIGKPIMNQERFGFLELGNKKIIRVNIIGSIIEKYESEGEKKYIFSKIDDGSGQISLKAFGDDIERLTPFSQGQTVLCIGTLRSFNNEVYIQPEIVKEMSSEYLLVRKLEIEKEKNQNTHAPQNSSQTIAVKDKILTLIKKSEQDGGIEIDKIILEVREASPDIINAEIKRMLE